MLVSEITDFYQERGAESALKRGFWVKIRWKSGESVLKE